MPTNPFASRWETYTANMLSASRAVSPEILLTVGQELRDAAYRKDTIYTAGNGASASLSQHWACDHLKGASGIAPLSVVSLASNMALLTALGNDTDYANVFTGQLRHHTHPNSTDLLVLISASGASPNIVNVAEFVRKERPHMMIIGLTGFTGGPLQHLSHHSLYVPFFGYEIVEDVHSMIMHTLALYLRDTLKGHTT